MLSSYPYVEGQGGIPPRAIRPLGTLHLTVGVMSLRDDGQLEAAKALLAAIDLDKLLLNPGVVPSATPSSEHDLLTFSGAAGSINAQNQPHNLIISLQSIESMHNPAKTSTLYTVPHDHSGRLYPFCSALRAAFVERDLMVADERPLLLHATILNTVYAKGSRGGSGGHGRNRARLTFQADELLEKYRTFQFCKDLQIEKMAICKMGAMKKVDAEGLVVDEEYEVVAEREITSTCTTGSTSNRGSDGSWET